MPRFNSSMGYGFSVRNSPKIKNKIITRREILVSKPIPDYNIVRKEELFSLDITFARFMLPRLKRFQNTNTLECIDFSKEDWDLMIKAFELIANEEHLPVASDETRNTINKGLKIFTDNVFSFWC